MRTKMQIYLPGEKGQVFRAQFCQKFETFPAWQRSDKNCSSNFTFLFNLVARKRASLYYEIIFY